jgi:hypothetical protein
VHCWNEILSTHAPGFLGSFPLVKHTYEEVGMQLDPEGHLIVGGRHFLPVSVRSLCDDGKMIVRKDGLPASSPSVSCPTPWERNTARLCQRVSEVQTLIREDLREIDEPLTTLGGIAHTLTQEQVTQWEAAKAAYDQALLECCQALARILLCFMETQEPLEPREDLADGVLIPMEAIR